MSMHTFLQSKSATQWRLLNDVAMSPACVCKYVCSMNRTIYNSNMTAAAATARAAPWPLHTDSSFQCYANVVNSALLRLLVGGNLMETVTVAVRIFIRVNGMESDTVAVSVFTINAVYPFIFTKHSWFIKNWLNLTVIGPFSWLLHK